MFVEICEADQFYREKKICNNMLFQSVIPQKGDQIAIQKGTHIQKSFVKYRVFDEKGYLKKIVI